MERGCAAQQHWRRVRARLVPMPELVATPRRRPQLDLDMDATTRRPTKPIEERGLRAAVPTAMCGVPPAGAGHTGKYVLKKMGSKTGREM